MKTELAFLLGAVVLAMIQVAVAIFGAMRQVGLEVLAGNRENIPDILGWAGRAARAHRNMLESLVLFAALVLTAHATGVSNAITVLGAQLFLWGRVAYAVLYVAGVPWARTAAWSVAVLGMLLILSQLVLRAPI
jgi:uncharacterized MAPEG superfamily protein